MLFSVVFGAQLHFAQFLSVERNVVAQTALGSRGKKTLYFLHNFINTIFININTKVT